MLRERLQWGEQTEYRESGDPLEYFVSEFLGQDFDFLDEIVAAVIYADPAWPPDGDEPFFDEIHTYERQRVFPDELQNQWDSVQKELLHSRRYFSSRSKSFFLEFVRKYRRFAGMDRNRQKKSSEYITAKPQRSIEPELVSRHLY